MPHSFPIHEIKHTMALSHDELRNFLTQTPYSIQSHGVLRVFGQAQYIPHIKLQVFLALMRLNKLTSPIKLQPYLFPIIMLHPKWLQSIRPILFPEEPKNPIELSAIEVEIYLKMGGGTHWKTLDSKDLSVLPCDLSGLTGVQSCTVYKKYLDAVEQLNSIPSPFELTYIGKHQEEIRLHPELRLSRIKMLNVTFSGSIPKETTHLHLHFSSITNLNIEKETNLEVLDISYSKHDSYVLNSILLKILLKSPKLKKLYICGTKIETLPDMCKDMSLEIYSFASPCSEKESQADIKLRTLLFGKDKESYIQGKELIDAMRNIPSRIQGETCTIYGMPLAEGFAHSKEILHEWNQFNLTYTQRENIVENSIHHLCAQTKNTLSSFSWNDIKKMKRRMGIKR